MKRGFKSQSEKISEEARAALNLSATDTLSPWDYAESLSVAVMGADELDLSDRCAKQLLQTDAESWSGLTMVHDGAKMVVLNSAHARVRQCSTLMHELAHIRLGHIPSAMQFSESGMLLLSDYSDEQEDEADWLMGSLLIPRVSLVEHRSAGKSLDEIAKIYGVSHDLCTWRARMTGVETQLRRRRYSPRRR